MRDSKNMKKVHKVAVHSAMQMPTQCSALSALLVCLVCTAIAVVYWHPLDVYSFE